MTERYYFDTDCLSAFLWVRGESILSKLYSGHIILPAQVYDELSRVPHLFERVEIMRNDGKLIVESIEVNSEEYMDYLKMTSTKELGLKIIGRGEAAGIAMVKARGGILASNNLRDIMPYVQKYKLEFTTTGDILIEAMNSDIISEDEGNNIWTNMIKKRRMLPTDTFSEYVEKKKGKRDCL